MPSPPSVLIVGTGAMACLFSARLLSAGISVTMLGTWQEGVAALRGRGVTLIEADGQEFRYPVRVVSDLAAIRKIDIVLVLVKSWQTERAARQLRDNLPRKTLVMSFQNGLGNREKLAEFLGNEGVFQGIVTLGATLLEPGRVRAGGTGLISLENRPVYQPLIKNLEKAGFTIDQTAAIEPLIWGKLAVNAAINPLTAILEVRNGVLLTLPSARALISLITAEVAAVAMAQGIRLPFEDGFVAVEKVAQRTANNISSMLQDIRRGAPTEIEAINGAVVRMGEKFGVPVPVNRTLTLTVQSKIELNSKQKV